MSSGGAIDFGSSPGYAELLRLVRIGPGLIALQVTGMLLPVSDEVSSSSAIIRMADSIDAVLIP